MAVKPNLPTNETGTSYHEMEIPRGFYTIPINDGHYDLSEFFIDELNQINRQVIRRLNSLPQENDGDTSELENTRTNTLNRHEAKTVLSLIHEELKRRRQNTETPVNTDQEVTQLIKPETKKKKIIDAEEELDDMESFFKERQIVGADREKIIDLQTKIKARLAKEGLPADMQQALVANALVNEKITEQTLGDDAAFADAIIEITNEMMNTLEKQGLRFEADGTLEKNIAVADSDTMQMLRETQAFVEVAIKLGEKVDWMTTTTVMPEKKRTSNLGPEVMEHLQQMGISQDDITTIFGAKLLTIIKDLNYRSGGQAILIRAIDQNSLQTADELKKYGVKKISNTGEPELGFLTWGKDKKIAAIKQTPEYLKYKALQDVAQKLRSVKNVRSLQSAQSTGNPTAVRLGAVSDGIQKFLSQKK